ncbi:hypothetical protein G6F68_021309 [Rhizopus microsporus]|nr:hypothetical protein G6F68_021309 [Rhizopus microsporus]
MPGRSSTACAPSANAAASPASDSAGIAGVCAAVTSFVNAARTPSCSTHASQPICRSQLATTGARTPSASNTTMRAPRTARY